MRAQGRANHGPKNVSDLELVCQYDLRTRMSDRMDQKFALKKVHVLLLFYYFFKLKKKKTFQILLILETRVSRVNGDHGITIWLLILHYRLFVQASSSLVKTRKNFSSLHITKFYLLSASVIFIFFVKVLEVILFRLLSQFTEVTFAVFRLYWFYVISWKKTLELNLKYIR